MKAGRNSKTELEQKKNGSNKYSSESKIINIAAEMTYEWPESWYEVTETTRTEIMKVRNDWIPASDTISISTVIKT